MKPQQRTVALQILLLLMVCVCGWFNWQAYRNMDESRQTRAEARQMREDAVKVLEDAADTMEAAVRFQIEAERAARAAEEENKVR